MSQTLAVLLGIYLIIVLGFASTADNDPDAPATRSDRIRELAAAIAWPLFHVQWRPDRGQHRRPRANADFPWVGIDTETPVATA